MSTNTTSRAAYAHTNYFGGHTDDSDEPDEAIDVNESNELIDAEEPLRNESGTPPETEYRNSPDDSDENAEANEAEPYEEVGATTETENREDFEPDDSFEPPTDDDLAEMEALLTSPELSSKQLGVAGECYAALWLARLGWRPLATNWNTRFGELDIIMFTPERIVVFVEVKTRRTQRYGVPQAAITPHKQANLHHAAALWLAGPGKSVPRTGIRFDALSILVQGGAPHVKHIPGAF
ncbi:YraN family protein [Bifidobacterium sp. ESL0790]|uniref:YraN family protein n=1 Tax=Bifidobacterium sp. ESL0790 TaxID=2983233 RepID=UPI0023F85685|nr:YraN family protein [Bifidobacterium sp. ESL0790]WEV72973.1 YraN family protein [Bifidobacterium sp. ESL0790]